jgi:hypothetical protein
MIIKMGIVLIALVVVIVGACIIYGRSLVRKGRDKQELHRRRVEDAERKEMFSEGWNFPPPCKCELHPVDEDTKTLPPGAMA